MAKPKGGDPPSDLESEMTPEDDRLTLEDETAAGRSERLELSQERRTERLARRRSDRQFMGVLLIFAVLFFGIGIVLARTVWRPKAAAPVAGTPTATPEPPPTATPPLGEPATPTENAGVAGDPASSATADPAASGDGAAYDVSTRDPIPFESKAAFAQHMKSWRNEEDKWVNARWERYQQCLELGDLKVDRVKQAFLATPRHLFCRQRNQPRAYEHAYLDIGWGVTISGPHIVCRMTNALDPQPEHKCLEIGTGSGYQAAVLANLSNHVYSVEIIKPLAQETKELYADLVAEGYEEYKNVHLKAADGYYGWEEHAPFDRIIVTCGIDHVPPDLVKQLAPNGIIVIPVGTYDSQKVLKITKKVGADGEIELPEEDLYPGRTRPIQFVPFTAEGGGTHYR